MTTETINPVRIELERIAAQHGGLLDPKDVVAEAASPLSPLHDKFEWDDAKCGQEYRLFQARQLIRAQVTVIAHTGVVNNVFVSLKSDRGEGGYRFLVDVLSDKELAETLLDEALAELKVFRKKYATLKALAKVFASIDQLE